MVVMTSTDNSAGRERQVRAGTVPVKRVYLRLWVEVPTDTDPAYVAEVLNSALNDDDGRLCQWGEWLPGDATLVSDGDVERRLLAIEQHLQIGPLQPGETRYGQGGNSVHMHVSSGPCTCGEIIPALTVYGS